MDKNKQDEYERLQRAGDRLSWILIIVLLVIALALAVAWFSVVKAEGPEYGVCRVYSWDKDTAWLVWEQAPSNPKNVEVTLYLKDLKTGQEFLTGVDQPYWISGDAYVPFYYKFSESDYQIRQLVCVARYVDHTVDTTNPGPWALRFVRLPIAR